MIPKINMKSIPKDMGTKDFNIYFENVPDVITSSFNDDSTLLWKGQESIYIRLNLMKFSGQIFYAFFSLLSDKTGMDIMGFDRKLIKIAG